MLCLFFSAAIGHAQAENGEIEIQTVPSLQQLRPHSDPVRIILKPLDSDGRAVQHGKLHIRLIAPPPGWLFSTDLPLVEGTDLLEMNLPVSQGQAVWEYVFPIRGVYRLEVKATDQKGKEIQGLFELAVKESRLKLFYLAGFITALFFFGFMAGRLFTGRRQGS